MRNVLIVTIFLATVPSTTWGGYQEVRELTLDTQEIETMTINAGNGHLNVVGVSNSNRLVVVATIRVSTDDEDKARQKIARHVTLTLQQHDEIAELRAYTNRSIWGWGNRRSIDLDVRIPESMHLSIRDGTGSIKIENVSGNLSVVDGTGSVTMKDVGGNVKIKDGTGSMSISSVGGDLSVKDGTGAINICDVEGGVIIDDGTGGIKIAGYQNELIIVNAGTGTVNHDKNGSCLQAAN